MATLAEDEPYIATKPLVALNCDAAPMSGA